MARLHLVKVRVAGLIAIVIACGCSVTEQDVLVVDIDSDNRGYLTDRHQYRENTAVREAGTASIQVIDKNASQSETVGHPITETVKKTVKPSRHDSDRHQVKAGETLYSIAWRYDLSYRRIAELNGLEAPYTIFPGQEILLPIAPVEREQVALPDAKTPNKNQPLVARYKKQLNNEKLIHEKDSKSTSKQVHIEWVWPASGAIVKPFFTADSSSVSGLPQAQTNHSNGVDIAGEEGDTVRAAADGTVVYSGNGLVGYGNLLIIRHNEDFLSAYAHNRVLLVKEGAAVKAGDKIAELGSTGAESSKLHFEIRREGQPVDPLNYLPAR